MRDFNVYFELYGKKMKATVTAVNEEEAITEVKNKIVFHKVEKSKGEFNQTLDIIDKMIDILK